MNKKQKKKLSQSNSQKLASKSKNMEKLNCHSLKKEKVETEQNEENTLIHYSEFTLERTLSKESSTYYRSNLMLVGIDIKILPKESNLMLTIVSAIGFEYDRMVFFLRMNYFFSKKG